MGGFSRQGDLPGDPVRIHDGDFLLPEEACHGAFSGTDSSREAEDAHAENDTTDEGFLFTVRTGIPDVDNPREGVIASK
jgi:hypothetical protein